VLAVVAGDRGATTWQQDIPHDGGCEWGVNFDEKFYFLFLAKKLF
jgi:hypothetical protein